jgi:hypothetical protein
VHPVRITEYESTFLQPGDEVFAAFILSDDPERPGHKQLTLRVRTVGIDAIHASKNPETVPEFVAALDELFVEFKRMVHP